MGAWALTLNFNLGSEYGYVMTWPIEVQKLKVERM